MRTIQTLHSEWEFRLLKENISNLIPKVIRKELDKWIPAEVPGTVHTDLIRAKLIPDPYFSDNENLIQWVTEMDWVYRTTFQLVKNFDITRELFLEFKGLDTITEIRLNNKVLGNTSNMFLEYRYNIQNLIKNNNILEIRFRSPLKYGRSLEAKYGKLPVALNSERVYLRKAQYSFGWDWGPSLPTSGIWKSVTVVQYPENYIRDFYFHTLSADKNSAEVEIKVSLNKSLKSGYKLRVDIGSEREFMKVNKRNASIRLRIKNPDLWFPNGIGKPNLYKITLQVLSNRMEVIDRIEKEVGIRTIKLQLIDNKKASFRFIVNNIPVYAKGANWIPSDSFITEVSENKYQKLLNFARISNMNMIRIWGGGFYENDILYNLCDRMGILIWHDFMFACAAYPEYKDFINNVENEIDQNVSRLQYHPSIALWCGNNENEWIWYQQQKSLYQNIPGFKIWNKIIPGILQKIDPQRNYWQSSPFNDVSRSESPDPNSTKSGNRHQWDLWSRWLDYNSVKDDKSLFVTEFGFQAPANFVTWDKVLPADSMKLYDRIFEFHNKQIEGPERVVKFLTSHLPFVSDWKDFIYLAQLSQAFALKVCLEHWISRYPETSGSIIWQLNDSNPVTSWSLIDYELIPKISWYAVKRVFSLQSITISEDKKTVRIFNHSPEQFIGLLQLDYINSETGTVLHSEADAVKLQPFQFRDFKTEQKHRSLIDTIIIATLYNERGIRVNRTYQTNTEWKYLRLNKCKLNASFKTEDEHSILHITTDSPAYFVDVYHRSYIMSDRGFILLPGEHAAILTLSRSTSDFRSDDIRMYTLNDYLNK